MKIGFNKQKITPQLPIQLAGYLGDRFANGIHDDLFVRCVVFEEDNLYRIFLTLDLLAIDHLYMDELHRRIKDLNLENVEVEVFCIHTHSAPKGICDTLKGPLAGFDNILGVPNKEYINYLCDQSMKVIIKSCEDMEYFTMKIAIGENKGIGKNRHNPIFEGDESLLSIVFKRIDQKQLILYHFACHPTLLHENNLLISADFIGSINELLENDFDMSMFINGSCGDISTRFTRQASTIDELLRYGKLAKMNIMDSLKLPIYEGNLTHLNFRKHKFDLELKEYETVDQVTNKIERYKKDIEYALAHNASNQELRVLQSYNEGAVFSLIRAHNQQNESKLTVNISMIEFNEFRFICIPAELFSQLSNSIKSKGPYYFFNYANGYLSYFANEDAYDQGYYESMCSPLKKGQAEILMDSIQNLL